MSNKANRKIENISCKTFVVGVVKCFEITRTRCIKMFFPCLGNGKKLGLFGFKERNCQKSLPNMQQKELAAKIKERKRNIQNKKKRKMNSLDIRLSGKQNKTKRKKYPEPDKNAK